MSEIRGIVLQSGKGWAVVLLKNGEYRRVRTLRVLMPGEIYQGKNRANYGKYTAAAAIFLIMFLGVVDFFNVVAYAEVSSGIAMGVNRWNRVVSVSAVNSEGEMLLEEISVKGQNLEAALETILEEALAEESNSDSSKITVLIKKADDKPLPPGIAKKVENVIAQDGKTDYDLIQLQPKDKEKAVYGLTVRDQVAKGKQNKGQDDDTDSQEEPSNGAEISGNKANDNSQGNANANANANSSEKKETENENQNENNENAKTSEKAGADPKGNVNANENADKE